MAVDVRPEEDDPRLAFVYREALRGLTQQQGVLESLLTRAGLLVFAASLASSVLGSQGLEDGLGAWDWVALAALLALGVLVAVMLWPYYDYRFRFDPEDLLTEFVDAADPVTMTAMHRRLALRIKTDCAANDRLIRRIRVACQVALLVFVVEIVAWLLAIA